MTLDDRISKMLTCHHDVHCQNEEHCFEVAQYAHACRGLERLKMATARVQQVEIEEDMEYFSPPLHWESHLPVWRS
jgi:hypothetical protein